MRRSIFPKGTEHYYFPNRREVGQSERAKAPETQINAHEVGNEFNAYVRCRTLSIHPPSAGLKKTFSETDLPLPERNSRFLKGLPLVSCR